MLTALYFMIFNLALPEPTQVISGTFIDYETKQPIENVMIMTRRGATMVISDADGYFEVKTKGPGRTLDMGLGPGRYLEVIGVGYLQYNFVMPVEDETSLGTIEMFTDYSAEVEYGDSIRLADQGKYALIKDEVSNYCFEFEGNDYAIDFYEEISLNVVLTKEEYCD